MLASDDTLPAWTWLPLTSLQATIFGWSGLLNNPSFFEDHAAMAEDDEDAEGFLAVLPDGVPSRIRYIYGAAAHGRQAALY